MQRSTQFKILLNILLVVGWAVLQLLNSKIDRAASGDVILLLGIVTVWAAKTPQTGRQKITAALVYSAFFLCYAAVYIAGLYNI